MFGGQNRSLYGGDKFAYTLSDSNIPNNFPVYAKNAEMKKMCSRLTSMNIL